MLFKYQAFAHDGRRIIGHMWANHVEEVVQQLQKLRIQSIKINQVIWIKRSMTITELIDFLSYLTWMLRAGVSLQEALKEMTLSAKTKKQCQAAIRVLVYIESGLFLSEAMTLLPSIFNVLTLYYTRIGEKSGQLVQQFDSLILALQAQVKWRSHFIRVLIYPMCSLLMAIITLLYLLFHVVPNLLLLLPTHASSHLKIQVLYEWLNAYGVQTLYGFAISLITIVFMIHFSSTGRYNWHKILLRFPVVGSLVRDTELTRMTEVMAHLHRAGFTLLYCLQAAQELMPNQFLKKHIQQIAMAMEAGTTLANSFTESGIFPPILLRALYLAEQSGHVAIALTHVATFFQQQRNARMEIIEGLLGPVCLLLVGGILMGLILNIFAPLFDIVAQVY